ncbi:NAD(+) diphosphatase [bacterium]|nr:NAD(+) diphosphatase [bacterium]
MIQDIYPHTLQNEFIPSLTAQGDDLVLNYALKSALVKVEDGRVTFPKVSQISAPNLTYAFSIDQERFFLSLDTLKLEEFALQPLANLRSVKPDPYRFAIMSGYHLYTWYTRNKFCGRCSHPMLHHPKLRAMECPECKNISFPRIDPAVIVGVVDRDRILVTKYAGRDYKGLALIAGFCEFAETVEETVKREVKEEVGLKVSQVKYFASQPWGKDSNLLLGFFAQAESNQLTDFDHQELSSAQWITREDLPQDKEHASLTAHMIEHFRLYGSPFT